jgi:hypothetical protein
MALIERLDATERSEMRASQRSDPARSPGGQCIRATPWGSSTAVSARQLG